MFGKDSQLTFIMVLLIVMGIGSGVFLLYTKGINLNKIKVPLLQRQEEPKYPGKLIIKSSAFENNSEIPEKYTCKGTNVNPPLELLGAPIGTQSFVLVIDDPYAPIKPFDHWLVFNINPKSTLISENSIPTDGVSGQNGVGKSGYYGPCPQSGIHKYFFKVYAVDKVLTAKTGATKTELAKEMSGHILDKGVLVGTFGK